MSTRIYKKDPQSIEDRKLLGTVHTPGSINEYYHARIRTGERQEFVFLMVSNTKSKTTEYLIAEKDLPENIKAL